MRKLFSALLLLTATVSFAYAQADSLGIEKSGDKVFVIHKVQSQQTLYSLARRYQTSVTEINEANPVLKDGLQVGQTLKIPFGGTLAEEKPVVQKTTYEVAHTVAEGETLFAIARQYGVSVSDVKAWNSLDSNAISLGQKLTIQQVSEVPVDLTTETAKESNPEQVEEEEGPVTDTEVVEVGMTTEEAVEEEAEPVRYGGTPFESFETEGIAEVINEETPSNKYFALHRDAKVGTVIKVKNLMNDLTVYVRVVGIIPDVADNENVLIKLNQKAYDHLKAVDKRFRVQLNYFQ